MQVEDSCLSIPFYREHHFWKTKTKKQKRAQNFLQDIKLKNINITNNLPLILLSSFNSLLQIGHMLDILLK